MVGIGKGGGVMMIVAGDNKVVPELKWLVGIHSD